MSSKRIHCMRCGEDDKVHKARNLCSACYKGAEALGVLDFYPHASGDSTPHVSRADRLNRAMRERES